MSKLHGVVADKEASRARIYTLVEVLHVLARAQACVCPWTVTAARTLRVTGQTLERDGIIVEASRTITLLQKV